MSYELLRFEIEGVSPLILHNGQLSNPMNEYARAIKAIAAKKNKKTDADIVEMMRLEFLGGLYVGDDSSPVMPGFCIEAMICSAARRTRNGKDTQIGVISDGNWPIIYDGPKDPEALFEDERFVDHRSVKLKGIRIMRTRPRFNNWRLIFDVAFLPDVLNRSAVQQFVADAGVYVGLCDHRPKFGRFNVVRVDHAA